MSDVRMRGFSRRTSVRDAWSWIDDHAARLDFETVGLLAATGRTLAADITSRVDVPSFARAMMDGYAVRAADVAGATDYQPLELEVIGTALPARPCALAVGRHQAIRVMTGAPLPGGADAVVPVEQTRMGSNADAVQVLAPVAVGRHVGRVGEDVATGDVVLATGRRIRPQDLGVMSSIGIAEVEVVREPLVRILITGDEVLPAGSLPQPYQIVDANGPMLAALVARDGGRLEQFELVPDDPDRLSKLLQGDADVILVSGGSSVGQEDHAPQLVRTLGELAVHGVAMRPSSPAGFGRIGDAWVFLLPGNPVSCLCAYDFFAGRLIRQLGGRSAAWPYPLRRLPLAEKLSSTIGRTDYARVRIEDGKAVPLAIRGASILSSTTRADGFVVVEENSEGYPAGEEVGVYLYDSV